MLDNMPPHNADRIAITAYLGLLSLVTIVGFALGYPQAMWVWVLPLLTGWDSIECNCEQCTETQPTATEIISQKYAKGEISDKEIDEKIERVEKIKSTDQSELETSFNNI